jgi:hypothetical protein
MSGHYWDAFDEVGGDGNWRGDITFAPNSERNGACSRLYSCPSTVLKNMSCASDFPACAATPPSRCNAYPTPAYPTFVGGLSSARLVFFRDDPPQSYRIRKVVVTVCISLAAAAKISDENQTVYLVLGIFALLVLIFLLQQRWKTVQRAAAEVDLA